ncbi:MAG: cobalamin-dependent protein [Spirochaetales bacterium]|nr:cobalamin-dependent protein [Spirochaetales bacterium]
MKNEKTMQIAVAVPPVRDFYYTPHRASALGARIVENVLFSFGHSVQLFNFPAAKPSPHTIPLPRELNYLKELLIQGETGETSFFTSYKHYGPSFSLCAEEICSEEQDIIFLACFAFAYAEDSAELIRAIRHKNQKALIVIGGAGVSAFPEWFLENTDADAVIRGEAEVIIPPLLKSLQSAITPKSREAREGREKLAAVEALGALEALEALEVLEAAHIPGLYTQTEVSNRPKKQNSAYKEPLPQAQAEAIIPFCSKVRETRYSIQFSAVFSRGCPKHCAFCPGRLGHGPGFRRPSLSRSLQAVHDAVAPYAHLARTQVHSDTHTSKKFAQEKSLILSIEDDNILADTDFFLNLLTEIKQQYPHISFTAENGIDYLYIDIPLLDRLIDLGFRQFNFSAGIIGKTETALADRPSSLNHLKKLAVHAAEREIPVINYVIVGHNADTPAKAVSALMYLASIPGRVGISPFYTVPGLPGFTDMQQFRGHSPSLCKGSSLYPWNGSLTSREMVSLFRIARLINLMKKENRRPQEEELIRKSFAVERLFTYTKRKRVPGAAEKSSESKKQAEPKLEIIPVPERSIDNQVVKLFFETFETFKTFKTFESIDGFDTLDALEIFKNS